MMSSENTHRRPNILFWIITAVAVVIPACYVIISTPSIGFLSSSFVADDTLYICNSREFICINHATEAELTILPGIGATKAKETVDYRKTNGYFANKEEIMLVKGIGEGIYEDIKHVITVQ